MAAKLEKYEVILTKDAVQDLEELFDFISVRDAPAKADHVLAHLEKRVASLETLPERNPVTKELSSVGIRDYRETYFKPFRIIYRVIARHVYVYVIVDGRRDMQALLIRRLLRA